MSDVSSEPSNGGGPGLYLRVNTSPNDLVVEYAAPIRRVPLGLLRAPLHERVSTQFLAAPASELVLHVRDELGREMYSFGWPSELAGFWDRKYGFDGNYRIKGTVKASVGGVSLLRIPTTSGDRKAHYLHFARATVGTASQHVAVQKDLCVYRLPGAPGTNSAPGPLETLPAGLFRNLPEDSSGGGHGSPPPGLKPLSAGPIPTVGTFNIAVMGDGFDSDDQSRFRERVKKLEEGLQLISPFSNMWDKICIRRVDRVSENSGIPGCSGPNKCPGDDAGAWTTYFGLRGCFNGSCNPGFVGTDQAGEAVIRTAAADVFGEEEEVHLYVVLANCRVAGGGGYFVKHLVYLPLGQSIADFVNTGAHEFGHAIAGLADEYIACSRKDVFRVHANQATKNQVQGNQVPWQSVATGLGKVNTSTGALLHVHHYGDTAWPSGDLGAFWGCQDLDPDAPDPIAPCSEHDSRGQDYYRPAKRCRMRELDDDFCDVCSAEIERTITEIAGP